MQRNKKIGNIFWSFWQVHFSFGLNSGQWFRSPLILAKSGGQTSAGFVQPLPFLPVPQSPIHTLPVNLFWQLYFPNRKVLYTYVVISESVHAAPSLTSVCLPFCTVMLVQAKPSKGSDPSTLHFIPLLIIHGTYAHQCWNKLKTNSVSNYFCMLLKLLIYCLGCILESGKGS